jgi:hypothetical protein
MSLRSVLALSFALCLTSAANAQTLSQVFAFDCPGPLQKCAEGAAPTLTISARTEDRVSTNHPRSHQPPDLRKGASR